MISKASDIQLPTPDSQSSTPTPFSLPLIAVDIGNSSTKLGWAFERESAGALPLPAQTYSFATGQPPQPELLARLPRSPARWAIISVHREGSRLLGQWLAENRPRDEVRHLTYRDMPIEIRVEAPERVGLDRLAAAVAANSLRRPGRAAIVIDAGSAITVDLVSADGAFEGGAILPGFAMSAQALSIADLLPLARLAPNDEPPAAVGKDTRSAIHSGLFWGAVGGVRELVRCLSDNLDPPPEVSITGGDLRQLSLHIAGSKYRPNLVHAGIALAGNE
jgi:type III pantothenate kinase